MSQNTMQLKKKNRKGRILTYIKDVYETVSSSKSMAWTSIAFVHPHFFLPLVTAFRKELSLGACNCTATM